MRFVLASASPARFSTLRRAGVAPEVIVSGLDEDAVSADSTRELVMLLAERKTQLVAARVGAGALVLGCDSLFELDGKPLGKPASTDEATERWRAMRGRTGVLWTGHHLIDTGTQRSSIRTVSATVRFGDVSDEEIAAYVGTGEPSQVAGAFTIDGLGGWFIESIDGDPHNVVGVSLPALRAMLHELGHELASIGYPAPISYSAPS